MSDSENETKQHTISMFNHNRIGDVFIAMSPVLNGWGLFTILLVALFLIIYWWQHPHNFFGLVFTSVNTVAGFLNILMWLAVAAIGGLILNKFLLPFLRGLIQLFRPVPQVHAFNENFALYSGKQMQIHDHQANDVKNVYNHKITEVAPPQEVLALPAPKIEVPTGRQLLLDGTVERHLRQGLIILGPGEDGILKPLKIKRCFSTLISGIPSVGKTTTVFWIFGQLTLIGAKGWIVDPHMYFQDDEGNRSLASELAELSDSFIFPACEGKPQDVIVRIRWMYQQLRKRQQPGYIVRAKDTVIGIMDEFNSVADSIDSKIIVVKDEMGRPLNFAQTLALLEREGRKYGLHFMLIGHKWAKQDIGGDNAVRTNATTYLCHRLNDETQGNLLLGSGQGKKVLSLTVGSYWITGPTWNAEPAKITTPEISALDLPVLLEIKKRQVQVVNEANVIEADIVVPNHFPTTSQLVPEYESKLDNGNWFPPDGKQTELDNVKLSLVREMVREHKSQNEIIAEAFPGMRGTDATKEYRKYLAALVEAS